MIRIKKLLKIVIPTWKCQEVLDLVLLTVFLILRTFLSIYLAGVNGKIVKAIIERDMSLFIKRVIYLNYQYLDIRTWYDRNTCIICEFIFRFFE
jgi:hypothetical protein